LTSSFFNNHADIARELGEKTDHTENFYVSRNNLPPEVYPLNASGPKLTKTMHRIAAKIGMALHCKLLEKIPSSTCIIAVRWFSNVDALDGVVPQDFLKILGDPQTLSQGNWNVAGQFQYASRASNNGTTSAHFAAFRSSFAVAALLSESSDFLDNYPKTNILHPGYLRAPP
jgi:hypothetical protein